MSIRQAMLFVPRRLLASCSGPVAAPLASSAADTATAPIKQREPGWAPLSAATAAASGAASPLGVAAVLVAPKRNKPHLVVKPPPVGWKPAPKPLPMGIVPSSALRQGTQGQREAGRRRPRLVLPRGARSCAAPHHPPLPLHLAPSGRRQHGARPWWSPPKPCTALCCT